MTLSQFAQATAIGIPLSILAQYCLITSFAISITTIVAWSMLLVTMAIPYVFSGVVVSLALTRSPFPTGQVYGVDLLGAALGYVAVIGLLNVLDGPTTAVVAGVFAALSALSFAASAAPDDRKQLRACTWWRRPGPIVVALAAIAAINALIPVGIRPILVKDRLEPSGLNTYERWNSYSRIVASRPQTGFPGMWGASSHMPSDIRVPEVWMDIDGSAGTSMFHYDETRDSIDFLKYDLVNLAYHLPGIHKSAVIGVGGAGIFCQPICSESRI